ADQFGQSQSGQGQAAVPLGRNRAVPARGLIVSPRVRGGRAGTRPGGHIAPHGARPGVERAGLARGSPAPVTSGELASAASAANARYRAMRLRTAVILTRAGCRRAASRLRWATRLARKLSIPPR